MNYAIIGAGKVGQALARAFACKEIEVALASRQPPEAIALGELGNHWRGLCISRTAFQTYAEVVAIEAAFWSLYGSILSVGAVVEKLSVRYDVADLVGLPVT